jgi:hypothetical protein
MQEILHSKKLLLMTLTTRFLKKKNMISSGKLILAKDQLDFSVTLLRTFLLEW